MWPSSSGPVGSWAAALACVGCGCGSGRTCLASAATSRLRAAATPPPLGRCGGPGSPTPSAAGAVTPSPWMRGDGRRTTRRCSWSPPGATSAAATSRPGRRGWLPRRPLGLGKRAGLPRRSFEPQRWPHEEHARSGTGVLDRLLTVEEAAARLGTSTRFVRRLIFERRIAYTKLGRHVWITPGDLDALIAAGRIEAGSVYQQGA